MPIYGHNDGCKNIVESCVKSLDKFMLTIICSPLSHTYRCFIIEGKYTDQVWSTPGKSMQTSYFPFFSNAYAEMLSSMTSSIIFLDRPVDRIFTDSVCL